MAAGWDDKPIIKGITALVTDWVQKQVRDSLQPSPVFMHPPPDLHEKHDSHRIRRCRVELMANAASQVVTGMGKRRRRRVNDRLCSSTTVRAVLLP